MASSPISDGDGDGCGSNISGQRESTVPPLPSLALPITSAEIESVEVDRRQQQGQGSISISDSLAATTSECVASGCCSSKVMSNDDGDRDQRICCVMEIIIIELSLASLSPFFS